MHIEFLMVWDDYRKHPWQLQKDPLWRLGQTFLPYPKKEEVTLLINYNIQTLGYIKVEWI